jgi:hypothetical protein
VWQNFAISLPTEFTTRCLPGASNCGKCKSLFYTCYWQVNLKKTSEIEIDASVILGTIQNGALVTSTNGSVLELTMNWVRRGVIRTTYQVTFNFDFMDLI